MDMKKTILFSLAIWIFLTILFYILNFFPVLEKNIYFFTIVWVLLLVKLLILSKWYFRKIIINIKNGFILGIFTVLSVSFLMYFISFNILDLKMAQEYFYLFITAVEILFFCTYAGFEFDKTFTASK